jgi:hypothetical protein
MQDSKFEYFTFNSVTDLRVALLESFTKIKKELCKFTGTILLSFQFIFCNENRDI